MTPLKCLLISKEAHVKEICFSSLRFSFPFQFSSGFSLQVLFLLSILFLNSFYSFAQQSRDNGLPEKYTLLISSFTMSGLDTVSRQIHGINPFKDLNITDSPFRDNLSYMNYIYDLQNVRGDFLNEANKFDYSSLYYQMLATRYSLIGSYDEIFKYLDSSGIAGSNSKQLEQNTINHIFKNGGPNLISYNNFISSVSDKERAVFINESHQMAKHRILTTLMLKPLYDKGFRYLFLEALNTADSALNERGVPLMTTGGYINEPVFADLVREALKIGYKVLPMDYGSSDIENPTINSRDSMMAVNIAKIYKADPDAKILVHAGWAHIQENSAASWNTMGNFYKKMTDIDPLTIDQTSVLEVNTIFDKQKNIYTDNVKEISLYSTEYPKNIYDMTVLFPSTKNISHRPDWMAMNGYRNALPLSGPIYGKLQDSCLVQAFYKEEYLEFGRTAIPVDQVFIQNPADDYSLFLPQGEYIFRIVNNKKEVVETWDIVNGKKNERKNLR